MLIQLAAPPAEHQGMVAGAPVGPGRPPPWLIPHCLRCRQPVEEFTLDPVASWYRVSVQWTCCGRTGGTHLSVDEVLYKQKHGGDLIWVNPPSARTTR